eukprot:79670_1
MLMIFLSFLLFDLVVTEVILVEFLGKTLSSIVHKIFLPVAPTKLGLLKVKPSKLSNRFPIVSNVKFFIIPSYVDFVNDNASNTSFPSFTMEKAPMRGNSRIRQNNPFFTVANFMSRNSLTTNASIAHFIGDNIFNHVIISGGGSSVSSTPLGLITPTTNRTTMIGTPT